jgi:hypothetical protein
VQLRRRTPRTCAAALVAAAVVTTLTACSGGEERAKRRTPAAAGGPGRGWVRVAAPDVLPRATVVVGRRRFVPMTVAQDWSARGGPVRVPVGRVTWRRVRRARTWALRIASAVQPSRVVLYRYRSVGLDGVPDTASATESVCAAVAASCTVAAGDRGSQVVVTPRRLSRGGYFLIQAAWLVPPSDPPAGGNPTSPGEVSATWAFAATRDG